MAFTVLPLRELRKDAKLPIAIFEGQNTSRMLLNKGKVLTSDNLETLKRRGVTHVAIDSRFVKAIWATPKTGRSGVLLQQHFLAEQRKKGEQAQKSLTTRLVKPSQPTYDQMLVQNVTQQNAQHAVAMEKFWGEMASQTIVRADAVKMVAGESIEHLLADVDLFVKVALDTQQNEFVHQHCLSVAKLAMSIATILEHREDEVRQIGIGCMLSRVGIDAATRAVISRPRELTPFEALEMKKHPGRTWSALEKITDLPVGARQVAWQINERWNGTGYPRARSQNQIHPLSRIASVADVYIALTSARPHRSPYMPHDAIKTILTETSRGAFEPRAIRGLLRTISLFPIGSCVELSNSTIATVVRNHSDNYDRPVVQLLCDLNGSPIPEEFLDLNELPGIHIITTHQTAQIARLMQNWLNSDNDCLPVGTLNQQPQLQP